MTQADQTGPSRDRPQTDDAGSPGKITGSGHRRRAPMTPLSAFITRGLLLWWASRSDMVRRIGILLLLVVPVRLGLDVLLVEASWTGLPRFVCEMVIWAGMMLYLLSPFIASLPRGRLPLWRRWADMFAYALLYLFSLGLFSLTVAQIAGVRPAEGLAGAALPLQMTDPGWLGTELLRHASLALYLAMTGAIPVALSRRYHLGLEAGLVLATGRRIPLIVGLLLIFLVMWQASVLISLLDFLFVADSPGAELAREVAHAAPLYDARARMNEFPLLLPLTLIELIAWSLVAAFLAAAYAGPLQRAWDYKRKDDQPGCEQTESDQAGDSPTASSSAS